jgi:hypothetical protein
MSPPEVGLQRRAHVPQLGLRAICSVVPKSDANIIKVCFSRMDHSFGSGWQTGRRYQAIMKFDNFQNY